MIEALEVLGAFTLVVLVAAIAGRLVGGKLWKEK
jgi:hypothetical protein